LALKNMVGILLPTPLLNRIISGKPTHERARLYFEYGKKNGVSPILFDLRGLDLKKRRVTGYVWKPSKQRYIQTVCPLPPVVHKRYLTSSPKITALSRLLGKRLFNPLINRNKLKIYGLLRQNPRLQPYLPDTCELRTSDHGLQLIRRYPSVFIKPVIGSLGKRVSKIQAIENEHYLFHPYKGKTRSLSESELKQELDRQRLTNNHFLIQQGIPLAEYHGSPFDLRVSVQKGGTGRWQISGEVAKVARRKGILTNLSQNGTAIPAPTVLSHAFPDINPEDILENVRDVAIEVCRTLEKTYPAFADAGLDIGLDHEAHPWFIEVNFNDLRYSFHSAGEYRLFKNTYENPMRYAKFLLLENESLQTAT
jgi:hypothetical protein